MTQPQPEDTEPHVCRFSLSQLKLVDEFVTYTPAEEENTNTDSPLRKRILPPAPEQEPQHNVIIYGKAKQKPPIWRPLLYKGKLIDISGANLTLLATNEKYPETQEAISDNFSFRKEELLVLIPEPVFINIDPPPINESGSGVILDRFRTLFMEQTNGEEEVHGGADHRAFAAC